MDNVLILLDSHSLCTIVCVFGSDRSTEPETSSSISEPQDNESTASSSEDGDCNSQCCQDTLDVFQVTDETVLKRSKRVQGHTRQFYSEWFKNYPWLVLCVTKLKAFCAYYRYNHRRGLLTDKLGEVAFSTTGFNNWKKALDCFEHHSQSSLHKEAVLKIELMKQPNVVSMLDSTHKKKIRKYAETCY